MEARNREPVERLAAAVRGAVAMIGLGRTNLYRFMTAGEITFVKVAKRRLIYIDSLKGLAADGLKAND